MMIAVAPQSIDAITQQSKQWIDISVPITEKLPVWPGDPPVGCTAAMHLNKGDDATVSMLAMGAHTGTHVDSPAHFIPSGQTLEAMPFHGWLGPCVVVAIAPTVDKITEDVLSQHAALTTALAKGVTKVVFKTHNSSAQWYQQPFNTTFVAITPKAAQWLVAKGITLVGADYLSVEAYGDAGKGAPTHHALLGNGVRIIEGLYLGNVAAGLYELCCLPMRLAFDETGDGAPARVVIRPLM
jgi:arylformamidase